MDRDFVGSRQSASQAGAPRRAYRAAAALQNKRESREEGGREAGEEVGAVPSPLPKLYHRVEVRLSAGARFEEFDFSFYNRTRLLPGQRPGQLLREPGAADAAARPGLRSRVLMGHTCEREFCLT